MTARNQDIAPGNNPDKLTNEQVGEGYRLLTTEEIEARRAAHTAKDSQIEVWLVHNWDSGGWRANDSCNTYRVPISAGSFMPGSQIDWQARAEKAEQERDQLREALEERTDQYNQATEERDVLRAQLTAAQEEIASLKNALDVGQANCDDIYNDLKRERDVAKAKLQLANEKLTASRKDLEQLRSAAQEALDETVDAARSDQPCLSRDVRTALRKALEEVGP